MNTATWTATVVTRVSYRVRVESVRSKPKQRCLSVDKNIKIMYELQIACLADEVYYQLQSLIINTI